MKIARDVVGIEIMDVTGSAMKRGLMVFGLRRWHCVLLKGEYCLLFNVICDDLLIGEICRALSVIGCGVLCGSRRF